MNPKLQRSEFETVYHIWIWDFDIVWDLGFIIWNFLRLKVGFRIVRAKAKYGREAERAVR
jgi:hypothetical protein